MHIYAELKTAGLIACVLLWAAAALGCAALVLAAVSFSVPDPETTHLRCMRASLVCSLAAHALAAAGVLGAWLGLGVAKTVGLSAARVGVASWLALAGAAALALAGACMFAEIRAAGTGYVNDLLALRVNDGGPAWQPLGRADRRSHSFGMRPDY